MSWKTCVRTVILAQALLAVAGCVNDTVDRYLPGYPHGDEITNGVLRQDRRHQIALRGGRGRGRD